MSPQKPVSLEATFAQLEKLARERELERNTERDHEDWSAQGATDFERLLNSSNLTGHPPANTQNSRDPFSATGSFAPSDADCVCNQHPLGLYLKSTGGQSSFAICPACDPQRRCEDCQGTGQLRRFNLLSLKDEIIPGACACRVGRKRAERLNQIQLPRRYLTATFENLVFSHLAQSQNLTQKLNNCREQVMQFCENALPFLKGQEHAPNKIFLTLLGPVGTGKTLLGSAALKYLVEETGCHARFVDFLYLLGQLRETYSQNSSEEKILKPLREADVLLIDELGKGRAEKAWQMEKLDDLLNSRYNEGRITILTTNYLPPEVAYDPVRAGFRSAPANESFWEQSLPERIGARMYDRIVESSVFVDFIGLPSFRRATAEGFLQRFRSEISG
jgi:DNA replication protein DnaC